MKHIDRLRVLFVDDEDHVLSGIARVLFTIHPKWKVYYCNSPEYALSIIHTKSIKLDVAVVDIQMPGINGIDILRIIKRDYPWITRVTLSGRFDDDSMIRSKYNTHLHISKPIPTPLLAEKIVHAYLENYSRNQKIG